LLFPSPSSSSPGPVPPPPDPDPGRRFASASEMAEQLTGVLREVVALQSGRPRPALSTLFGAELRVTDTELFAEQVDDVSRLGARPTAPGRGGLFGRRGGGSKGGAAGSGAGPLPGIQAQGGGAPGQGGSASGGPVAPGAVTSAVAGALPVGGQPPGAGAGRGGPGAAPLTATATHVRGGAQGTGPQGGSHPGSRGGPSPGAQGTGAQASPYGGPRAGNVREGAHGGPRGTGEPGESRGGGPAAHARPAPSPVPTAHREAGSGPARPGPATPYGPFGAAAGGVRLAPFDAPATALALPVPRVDANDPNAGFLAGLMASAPAELIAALEAVPAASLETGLRELRARLELREQDAAAAASAALEARHPDDWRVVWYRGVTSLVTGDHEVAALSFDAVYDAFPGEPAPKLALGICAEVLGQLDNAAEYYRLVWATDPGFVSAAFGLARVQIAAGDRAGAARTLESVPEASIHYTAARVATVRARLRERDAAEPLTADLTAAGAQVAALTGFGLDPVRREQLTTEVLGKALDWVLSGSPGAPPPGGSAAGPPETRKLLGAELNERGLRLGLERSYRMLARLAQRGEERIELVERANRFRPRTWV
ncbi:tetratricopeptide repeat protein, partial [Streptomyces rhizosphaericola]|uniref:tetratricopeptide repeat protein n=1 Tax=Streptomyces rhizosphaericola TaxID=2564098 RepID=UPI003BF4E7FD